MKIKSWGQSPCEVLQKQGRLSVQLNVRAVPGFSSAAGCGMLLRSASQLSLRNTHDWNNNMSNT